MTSDGSRGRGLERDGATSFAPDLPTLHEGVEDAPLSRQAAQLAVEWKLNQRPQKQELIARNILTSIPASPALQSQAVKLQWEKKSNQLQQKIRLRPQLNDVVNMNILKDPKLAPGVQAAQDQLRRKNLAENLNQRIALRPGPLELIKEGILEPGDESIVQALKNIPLAKPSDVNEASQTPEIEPSPSEPLRNSAQVLRRKSVQEPSKSTAVSSAHCISKRHSIGGLPNVDGVFNSPPSVSDLSISFDDSNMDWESCTDRNEEGMPTRKASESSFGSLPSPIDFSCLQADSPILRSPESIAVSSSSSVLSSFTPPLSASVLCKRGGGVMSPRPHRKKSSSKNSKVRKYNFHEYKPPNHHGKIEKKPSTTTKPSGPYDYIVQQQQILLQIQLLQQQYPEQLSQIAASGNKDQQMTAIMKALGELSQQGGHHGKKSDKSGRGTPKMDLLKSASVNNSLSGTSQLSPDSLISCENGQQLKVEDIKVNHLRCACKERGLGVTGKKSELLERLLEHNNGKLPSSLVAEVMMERKQLLSSHSNSTNALTGLQVNGVQSKPQRSDSVPGSSKQKLHAEQLQEKIKEICEQSKRVHLSGKSGTLYPAPVVEAMYNFDIPVSSSTSNTSMPHGPSVSAPEGLVTCSQTTPSSYSTIRANSVSLSPDVGKRPSEDFLHIITSQSSPSFNRSPTPNPLPDSTANPEVLSPTRDLLEQLKMSSSVSWSPDTVTPNPEGLISLSNGLHTVKVNDSTSGVVLSQSVHQGASGLVRDTPLLTSTASQPFQDQLLSTTKSEVLYGCGNKDTMESSIPATHNSQNLFDFLDEVQPASQGLYGSSPLNPYVGKPSHLPPPPVPNPSPMLGIHSSTAKSGSDLYLTGHDYSHIQPSFPTLSRSPGSDNLEWLDLESHFASHGSSCAGHSGLTDLQFGEMGMMFDGSPSTGAPMRDMHQYHGPDLHTDLGFGSLGNSNFVDNSDIFQPTTSEQSFVEMGMTH